METNVNQPPSLSQPQDPSIPVVEQQSTPVINTFTFTD